MKCPYCVHKTFSVKRYTVDPLLPDSEGDHFRNTTKQTAYTYIYNDCTQENCGAWLPEQKRCGFRGYPQY